MATESSPRRRPAPPAVVRACPPAVWRACPPDLWRACPPAVWRACPPAVWRACPPDVWRACPPAVWRAPPLPLRPRSSSVCLSAAICGDQWRSVAHQPIAKRTQLAPRAAPSRARPSGRPRDLYCPPKGDAPSPPAGSCAALHHLPTQAVAVPLALALFPFVVRLCVICVICGPRPSPLPCRWFDPWRSVAICGPPPACRRPWPSSQSFVRVFAVNLRKSAYICGSRRGLCRRFCETNPIRHNAMPDGPLRRASRGRLAGISVRRRHPWDSAYICEHLRNLWMPSWSVAGLLRNEPNVRTARVDNRTQHLSGWPFCSLTTEYDTARPRP
jgi:hypothetical protein